MNYFENRKARKKLKEILHHAKHIRHMHEDIADARLLEKLQIAVDSAKEAGKRDDVKVMGSAGNTIVAICEKIAPPRQPAKLRENIEVIFVSIAAAMAIRAYVFQPFKIPTGSMQPTLYGITVRPLEEGEATNLPVRIAKFFWKGEVYLQADTPFDRFAKFFATGKQFNIRAKSSGYLRIKVDANGKPVIYGDNFSHGEYFVVYIGNTPHQIPATESVFYHLRAGEMIKKGEIILKGVAKAGDYILVNRLKYNFVRPKRGDITVFDTRGLTHPQVRSNAYYIKRMVGLPGETISIDPPYLLVNGKKPTDPRFDKIFHNDKYSGYIFAGKSQLKSKSDSITLGKDEYLFFGDNSPNSLDGRYFGSVKAKRIMGSAFFVGLPFDRAGFAETVH